MKKIGKFFKPLTFLIFISWIFLSNQAFAKNFKFEATVDQNRLTVDDTFTLTLVLSSDGGGGASDEEPTLPDLSGFEVLNKWNQSESSSVYTNGKFQYLRRQIYKYTLQPQKLGALSLGSAEITVQDDGKPQTLKSSPIRITVLASGSGGNARSGNLAGRGQQRRGMPGQQGRRAQPDDEEALNNPLAGIIDDDDDFAQLLRQRGLIPNGRGGARGQPSNDRDAFYISVDVDKTKVFEGEEIVAHWYLYTKGAIQNFDALKYPDLKGFIREELERVSNITFQDEVVNGIPYHKALLVSYALFPVGSGKKIIDPYKAKATVIEMNSAMSVFGMGRPYTYTKASKEIPIEVRPLPNEGRPSSFSGAVGKFHITGSLSATQVKANQPFSLKIKFQGQGNVKAIELPPLNLPSNVEVYDTKKESQFTKSGEGFQEFEVLLIPRAAGNLTIPAIPVSYFDPKTAKYVSEATPSFQIKVLPGESGGAAPGMNAPITSTDNPAAPEKLGKDIRYLKSQPLFDIPAKIKKIFWITIFSILILGFGISFYRVYRFDPSDMGDAVRKRVREKLKNARAKLKSGDSKGLGVECANAVLATLGEVTRSGSGSTSVDVLLSRLAPLKKSGSAEKDLSKLQLEIREFLSQCEILSFAPPELSAKGDGQGLKRIVNQAEKIISKLFELN